MIDPQYGEQLEAFDPTPYTTTPTLEQSYRRARARARARAQRRRADGRFAAAELDLGALELLDR